MSTLDDYILRCDEAAKESFPQDKRNALAKEIISGYHNTIQNIQYYRGQRAMTAGSQDEHTIENMLQLKAKLVVFREEQQRIFDEKYGTATLSEYIQRCKDAIADTELKDKQVDSLCTEVEGTYSCKIEGFENGLSTVNALAERTAYHRSDLPKILGKLSAYRDEVVRSVNSKDSGTSFHLEQRNSQTVSTFVDLNQTISQAWALPDSVLTSDEKMELTKLLNELEESKGEGKSKVKKAAKAVGNWLFDKAIEAVPTVMPFVAQSIQTATGA